MAGSNEKGSAMEKLQGMLGGPMKAATPKLSGAELEAQRARFAAPLSEAEQSSELVREVYKASQTTEGMTLAQIDWLTKKAMPDWTQEEIAQMQEKRRRARLKEMLSRK